MTRRRHATRTAILEAASQLIAEKGVDGFTMSDVAVRGQVNRALIYHYFRDRENLIFETIRHIVSRYDEIHADAQGDALEQAIRMHIQHPEIARSLFHLLLTGRQLPALSRRLFRAIDDLERAQATYAPGSNLDVAFAVIGGWLLQVTWSFTRHEVARHLGIPVEEADERMIAHLRSSGQLVLKSLNVPEGSISR